MTGDGPTPRLSAETGVHPPLDALDLGEARRIVVIFVMRYNDVRLHSAIGYVTPKDKLEGRAKAILAEREHKLARPGNAARKCAVPLECGA